MLSVVDANLKLGGPGFVSLALSAFFSSAIFLILPNKEGGAPPLNPPLVMNIQFYSIMLTLVFFLISLKKYRWRRIAIEIGSNQ